ncbi:hypothetical protein AB0F30_12070 [Streptomyces sp. NPDC029006]|uniref:hypothetical protein n=1 Tax=Streptomyces sp. NPDC029006 TaxID=3155467 RepID=UPI0033EA48C8
MTAEHEGADGAREYGGMDALMAAITGDPLPEEAHRDPAFRTGRRAAEADVALLRDRLHWLAEALTGERTNGGAAAGSAVAGPAAAGEEGARSAGAGAPATGAARAAGDAEARPAGAGDRRSPTRPPGRPGRRSRRVLRVAVGSLAGVAAFALVLGLGWLVTRAGGGADDSAADSVGKEARSGGRPADAERELACARLVVEGTVAKVRRLPDSPAGRITLTVLRSYKPAHGPAEVGFLLDGGTRPAPRTGQHVLVRVGRGEEQASLWAVGDAQVAAARAWITDALPASRHLPCP